MKALVCILLSFCTALTACTEIDPAAPDLGEKRLVRARLSGAPWQRCCRKAEITEECPDPVNSREKALKLLVVAGGRCLDKAVRAVESHAPEDRAAAYLIRAERNGDPVDLLRALETATGFNRALALYKLGLYEEAVEGWEPVTKEESTWGREAGAFHESLSAMPKPTLELEKALAAGDRAAVMNIARTFPSDAAEYFERAALRGNPNASVVAEALIAIGDQYPRAVMDAIARPGGRLVVERAFAAMGATDFGRAATLLEHAGNPLHIVARLYAASSGLMSAGGSLPLWDAVAARTPSGYRNLLYRIELGRANALEIETSQYLEAHAVYARALDIADGDPTLRAGVYSRRSQNYSTIGSSGEGLREALRALSVLHNVANLNTRHHTYAAAAISARQLGFPDVALMYQTHAVDTAEKFVDPVERANNLAVALRGYADLLVATRQDAAAAVVLTKAADVAKGVRDPAVRKLLQMRLRVVNGQSLLKSDPRAAVTAFNDAIELAKQQDSSFRAVLHFNRATAHRYAENPEAADEDTTTALAILRNEAQGLIDSSQRGEFEAFWSAYFSRFEEFQQEFIEKRIEARDYEGAFLLAEQTRAFEPLQLVLRSRLAPPGYRPIETGEDLQHHLANLPEDTAILQYLVLPRRTYTWVLVRGKITPFTQRADRRAVERWADDVAEAAHSRQRDPLEGAMRAVYDGLFRAPLAAARSKTRLVIVPDGPMHGLPFPAVGNRTDGLLIERASITTAASTSLYLYSLARDRQFPSDESPAVFIVGDPAFDKRIKLDRLPFALKEAKELARDVYPGARVLTEEQATIDRFLALGRDATIIHFAGHGIPNPQQPWRSRLLLAPGKDDSGELSAERLMQELSELERTRLVVLGACSTAAGHPVGPQGLAPLVRPLIAANVPAVVGTLWDVGDATAKQLLGSLHCHYRRGDDVAVALRKAQLERLRDNPLTWAPFQVVGHAGSPYARPAPSEETRSDRLCTENSLHRPDGLHPQ